MRSLAIIQAIHLGSRRVPRKLLEKVGDRSLLEIGFDKLRQVESLCQVPTVFAVSYEDKMLCESVDRAGFERIEIGHIAAAADSYQTVFAEWTRELASRWDWVIDANIICRPFLSVQSLLTLVEHGMTSDAPFVACLEERGLIWDDRNQLLVGKGQVADTKNNPIYYRLAHLGYAHPSDLWDEEKLSEASRPKPFCLSLEERIDIDTPEDLAFARLVAAGRASERRYLD